MESLRSRLRNASLHLFMIAWVSLSAVESDRGNWQNSNPVSYGGLSFICNSGCGDPWEDPDLKTIDHLFQDCLKITINRMPELYDELGEWVPIESPWEREERCDYSLLNWKLSQGIDNPVARDSVTFETHDKWLGVVERFHEDLAFYHSEKIRHFHDAIAKGQADLQYLQFLKNNSCLSIKYDENGEIKGYDAYHYFTIAIDEAMCDVENSIPRLEREIEEELEQFEQSRSIADEAFKQIDASFKHIFMWCLQHHQPEGIAFNGALESFLAGDFMEAIAQIRQLISIAEERKLGNDLIAKLYLLKGQVQSEGCLFADAIVDLTTAIQKNPSMKEAYLDRAAAYFELGQFDQALQDYLDSGLRPTYSLSPTEWGLGIGAGLLEGTGASLVDFVPSALGSLRGLSSGLWAFVQNPVGASQELIRAAIHSVEYLRAHTSVEMMREMVPELKELLQQGDQLSNFSKGQLVGRAIGKYGTDIFLAKYATGAIAAYRELKQANQLMTLEALATPEKTQAILAGAAKRWNQREQVLKNANLTIQWDKQGKHIEGHKNYIQEIRLKRNPSIFIHPDPELLVRKYGGTGIKVSGQASGTLGYKEVVDFEEFIGFAVEQRTGTKTATTWGTIHYAKEGIHIVPTNPRAP
jgi:tetratricopeptide (TPR) repeat protein